jgi:hypothetical protein
VYIQLEHATLVLALQMVQELSLMATVTMTVYVMQTK